MTNQLETEFNKRLLSLYRPTWDLKQGLKLTRSNSFLGASPTAPPNTWPLCSCGEKMNFVGQYNALTSKIDLMSVIATGFSFYVCSSCFANTLFSDSSGLCCHKIILHDSLKSRIGLMKKIRVNKKKSLPDWHSLSVYDQRLEDISCEMSDENPWDRYSIAEKECGFRSYTSQIGGFPGWGPAFDPHYCKECNKELTLALQLYCEDIPEQAWDDDFGNGAMFYLLCPAHTSYSVLIYISLP